MYSREYIENCAKRYKCTAMVRTAAIQAPAGVGTNSYTDENEAGRFR